MKTCPERIPERPERRAGITDAFDQVQQFPGAAAEPVELRHASGDRARDRADPMAGRPFRCQRGLAKSYHNGPTAGGSACAPESDMRRARRTDTGPVQGSVIRVRQDERPIGRRSSRSPITAYSSACDPATSKNVPVFNSLELF